MWEKIKNWFGFLDLNSDGKVTAEDLEIARALADKKYREANEKINQVVEETKETVTAVNDQITDAVTQTKKRVKRIKEEVKDVVVAAKEVANQAGDVVAAAKGKERKGRKKK
jgi:methyl-accepting chemotaxis protein